MSKYDSSPIVNGNIHGEKIKATHQQIRTIVDEYKNINSRVAKITKTVKENWIGEGKNEFETQYEFLIKRIDDFGDTLQDIYDALVEAEVSYDTADDELRQGFMKTIKDFKK